MIRSLDVLVTRLCEECVKCVPGVWCGVCVSLSRSRSRSLTLILELPPPQTNFENLGVIQNTCTKPVRNVLKTECEDELKNVTRRVQRQEFVAGDQRTEGLGQGEGL